MEPKPPSCCGYMSRPTHSSKLVFKSERPGPPPLNKVLLPHKKTCYLNNVLFPTRTNPELSVDGYLGLDTSSTDRDPAPLLPPLAIVSDEPLAAESHLDSEPADLEPAVGHDSTSSRKPVEYALSRTAELKTLIWR